MIFNNIPQDLFGRKFDDDTTYLFSDDSLFIYGFLTTDALTAKSAFQIWVYDVIKNKKSIFTPEINMKKILVKIFGSKLSAPSAQFLNKDVIVLFFRHILESYNGLLMTVKLNLSRGRISLVDSLLLDDLKDSILLKEGQNIGIAYTHVQCSVEEESHELCDDKFAAYYPIKQDNGFFLPQGDRIVFTYKYEQPYDDFMDPHLFDNKLWFFRTIIRKVAGPCIACMQRRFAENDHVLIDAREPYVQKAQLSYFDLTKKYPREVKFMVIENMASVLWQKNYLFITESEKPSFIILDLTDKTLLNLKDTGELLKFGSKTDTFSFDWGDRFIDIDSNITMIDKRKRQLLRVSLHPKLQYRNSS